MTVDPLAAALGRIPSGIYILTARHGDQETGMLASWVQQAGFEPPTVSVAVGRQRYLADWLTAGAPFALHVVGHHQGHLMKHFGRGFEPGEAAFTGLDMRRTANQVPLLVEALAYLECTPRGHVDSGDHRIFLAEVHGGDVPHPGDPLVHLRRSGLKY